MNGANICEVTSEAVYHFEAEAQWRRVTKQIVARRLAATLSHPNMLKQSYYFVRMCIKYLNILKPLKCIISKYLSIHKLNTSLIGRQLRKFVVPLCAVIFYWSLIIILPSHISRLHAGSVCWTSNHQSAHKLMFRRQHANNECHRINLELAFMTWKFDYNSCFT